MNEIPQVGQDRPEDPQAAQALAPVIKPAEGPLIHFDMNPPIGGKNSFQLTDN
jgi:hypothetical protein